MWVNSKCGHQKILLGTEPKGAASPVPSRLPLPPSGNVFGCTATTNYGQQQPACVPSLGQWGAEAKESQCCLPGHRWGCGFHTITLAHRGWGCSSQTAPRGQGRAPGRPGAAPALAAHPATATGKGQERLRGCPRAAGGQGGQAGKCPLLQGSAGTVATRPQCRQGGWQGGSKGHQGPCSRGTWQGQGGDGDPRQSGS